MLTMKHLITLFLAGLCLLSISQAQSLEFTYLADTVYYNPNSGTSVDAEGYLKNTSSAAATFELERLESRVGFGQFTNFCWGDFCYDPDVDKSQLPVTIEPDSINKTFKVTLTISGVSSPGYAIMKFTNTNDPNDTIRTRVEFLPDATLGMGNELSALGYNLDIQGSNRVQDMLTVQAVLPTASPATLEVMDMQGRVLQQQTLSQSTKINLGVSYMQAGTYFVRLRTEAGTLVGPRFIKQ